MRPTMKSVFVAAAAIGMLAMPAAQQGYLTPPQVIADIMNAPPLPTVRVSPDGSSVPASSINRRTTCLRTGAMVALPSFRRSRRLRRPRSS